MAFIRVKKEENLSENEEVELINRLPCELEMFGSQVIHQSNSKFNYKPKYLPFDVKTCHVFGLGIEFQIVCENSNL